MTASGVSSYSARRALSPPTTADRQGRAARGIRAAAIAVFLLAVSSAGAVQVELRVQDRFGTPLPARVRVRTSTHLPYPGVPDPALLSHGALGSYFYVDGPVVMDLPAGSTDLTVGRGFEWRAVHWVPVIQGDTLLVVELDRVEDLGLEGWYCGDTHVHTQHLPQSYSVGPEAMHRIARAEGLDQVWCLDQEYEFTGGPHAVSDPEATLYFTTEYRNQAYGHVALLGLKEIIGFHCCGPATAPAYPMLCDLWSEWSPAWDEAMVLAHPQTGADFFADEGWPECGLGRELPVQAALGCLDALIIWCLR